MKLYLVQHGESLTEDVNPKRPLSNKGKTDITKLAKFLAKSNIKVKKIFHSPKARAIETAQILAKNIGEIKDTLILENIKPNDPINSLTDSLNNWTEDSVVVGHLPYLSKLVSFLITNNTENTIVNYLQGSICCLEKNDQGNWRLCWMIRPELL